MTAFERLVDLIPSHLAWEEPMPLEHRQDFHLFVGDAVDDAIGSPEDLPHVVT